MAPFNPPVPDQTDPRYYLHLARPIEQPHFANAAENTLKTIGNIVQEGTRGVKDVLQGIGENLSQGPAEAKRAELTNQLESTLTGTQAGQPQTPENTFASAKPSQSLIAPEPGYTPSDLRNLPRQLQSLESAKANGKISLSQYYGEQDKLASDLRSRYSWSPAIVNGIDKTFAKVVGGDPANLRIHSLLSDINSYQTGKDKEKDEFWALLKANPFPGFEKLGNDVNTGRKSVAEGMSILAPYVSKKYELEMEDLRFKNLKNTETANVDAAKRIASEHAINTNFEMQLGKNITGPEDWTPGKVHQWYEDARTGKIQLRPEQMDNFGNMHLLWADQAEAGFKRRMAENGADKILGPQLMNEYVKQVREPWEQQADMWKQGKFGLAAGYKHLLDEMHAYSGIKLFTSKEVGTSAQLLSGARAAFGDNVAQSFFERNAIPNLQSGIKDLYNAMNARGTYEAMKLVSPPLPGVETSDNFKSAVDDIMNKAQEQNINTSKPTAEIATPLDTVKRLITDDKYGIVARPGKDGDDLIYKAFNPKNYRMLARMQPDQLRADGTTVEGKEAWFYSWTQPDVATRVFQSPYGQLYKDWALHTFEQEVAPQALQDLAATRLEGKNYQIQYENSQDGKAPKLALYVNGKAWQVSNPLERTPGIRAQMQEYNNIMGVLNRINKGMSGYYNVSKASGEPDVDAAVVGALAHGMPGQDIKALAGIGHLPAQIVEAIKASRQEEAEKKAKDQSRLPPKE